MVGTALDNVTKTYGTFKVKPIWTLTSISALISATAGREVQLYGVQRGSLDTVKNWEKISSVEHFNQGWAKHPTDYSITIAMYTKGIPFEFLRRMTEGDIMFDIKLDVLKSGDVVVGSMTPADAAALGLSAPWVPWLMGYESYKGCIVQRTGRSIEIGGLPVQEFEMGFLRFNILDYKFGDLETTSIESGDGSTPDAKLDELEPFIDL